MAEYQPSPLDDTLYKVSFVPFVTIEALIAGQEEDFAFIKEESGIRDSDAFKKHIIAIQSRAYSVGSSAAKLAVSRFYIFPAAQLPLHSHFSIRKVNIFSVGERKTFILDIFQDTDVNFSRLPAGSESRPRAGGRHLT
jgi:hypothetical protein